MAQFHPLTVTEVRKTISDAVIVTLEPEEGGAFDFIPGQYLTFRRSFDGEELRRSYSICAGLDDGVLQVGIKKVDGGEFSTWANHELQAGDRLEAMAPMGNFYTSLKAKEGKHYLGFAAGSGITPVLSILKTVLTREPQSRFTLVYANRSVNSIMFREELEDLKNQHLGRLTIIHILKSNAQEIELFQGRLDQEKCAALFKHWIQVDTVDLALICGPEPMMLAIAAALRQHGLSDEQIKYELFASAQSRRRKRPQTANSKAAQATQLVKAKVTIDGTSISFDMNKDISILDAALMNSLDAPHACKAGVCSTCKCRLLEGKVEMMANHALEDYEVANGYILSCQAYPRTGRVVIDYDQ